MSNDWFAGTSDSIAVSFLYPRAQTLLRGPSRGNTARVQIDLNAMFGDVCVPLSELQEIGLYQDPVPNPLGTDAWKLESLILTVNNIYYNRAFRNVNQWIVPPGLDYDLVWSQAIPFDAWTDVSDNDRRVWMTKIFDVIKNKTLRQLAIPGSHDAGMYTGSILGRTQDLPIYQQLKEGVRFFDLRPGLDSGYFVIYHGFIAGPKLEELLDHVAQFMSEPGRELVILKFSHYRNFSNDVYDNDVYDRLVQMIRRKLGNWLYAESKERRLADTTLSDIIATQGRIIVVCDGSYPVVKPCPGIFTYRDWDSEDPENGDLTVYDVYSNKLQILKQ